ncbi:hypothetical protein FHG87_011678 [Trinorchestia longiramus]|nr:hypothetical protein FHG87_011678 [Trinorchestia longiramus]
MPLPRCVVTVLVVGLLSGVSLLVGADEEDPLQHASEAVTKNRTLHEILKIFAELDPPVASDSPFKNEPCNHTELEDLDVPSDQTSRFKDGLLGALRLTRLLNALYLSPSHPDFLRSSERGSSGHLTESGILKERIKENLLHGIIDESNDRGYNRVSDTSSYADGQPSDADQGRAEMRLLEEILRTSLLTETSIVTLGIAFLRGHFQNLKGLWAAYAWRDEQNHIVVGDLAKIYDNQYDDDQTPGTRWFTEHLQRSERGVYSGRTPPFDSHDAVHWTSLEDGLWVRVPHLDCGASNTLVLTHSLPFFGLASNYGSPIAKLK